MADQEPKGFRVVDKRGVEKEEPKPEETKTGGEPKASAAPGSPGPVQGTGNLPGQSGVQEGKRPGDPESSIAGPTFLDLVMTLQMGTMVNLGLVQSRDGTRPPVNLPAAKDSIDMLEVLQDKTKGNLDDEEKGVLTEGLYHLRMAYVAAVNKAVSPPGGGQGGGGKKG